MDHETSDGGLWLYQGIEEHKQHVLLAALTACLGRLLRVET